MCEAVVYGEIKVFTESEEDVGGRGGKKNYIDGARGWVTFSCMCQTEFFALCACKTPPLLFFWMGGFEIDGLFCQSSCFPWFGVFHLVTFLFGGREYFVNPLMVRGWMR